MFVGADVWYCCLHPDDMAAVDDTSAMFILSLEQPIERTLFEIAWGSSQMYIHAGIDAVLYYYALEHTFIIIPDEPPIPAVGIVDLALWTNIELFLLSGDGACPDGCDIPSYLKP